MDGYPFALIPFLGMDGKVLKGHLSCHELWKSYPVVKRISLFCENVDFPFLIRLPDLDRCSCTRYSVPDDEISFHPQSPLLEKYRARAYRQAGVFRVRIY
jgi:hypothetical protein